MNEHEIRRTDSLCKKQIRVRHKCERDTLIVSLNINFNYAQTHGHPLSERFDTLAPNTCPTGSADRASTFGSGDFRVESLAVSYLSISELFVDAQH